MHLPFKKQLALKQVELKLRRQEEKVIHELSRLAIVIGSGMVLSIVAYRLF